MLKALLYALLEPINLLKNYENEDNLFARLATLEDLKTVPVGIFWDEFCQTHNVPKDFEWKFDGRVHTPEDNTYRILEILMLLVILAYPIHLIFRFIIWAVRTLRGRNEEV